MDVDEPYEPEARPPLSWPAVGRGVLAGVWLLAVVLVAQLILLIGSDDPSDAWAWILLALLLWGFARSGGRAARLAGERPITHGTLAALGLLVAWIPLRLIIGIAGDSDNPVAGIGAAIGLAALSGALAGVRELRRMRSRES